MDDVIPAPPPPAIHMFPAMGLAPAAPRYPQALAAMRSSPRRWLVTGGAGFIGSHLVEALLRNGQEVVVLDDFSTGHAGNLEDVRRLVGPDAGQLAVVTGDIRDASACRRAMDGVDVVLHQAALGSVPRSLERPLATHEVNVTGFLNVLEAARGAGIRRVVYASSSSVYGDHAALPKTEDAVGRPLSPYAASKRCDEAYAAAFGRCFSLELVGLRYFNVFGPRQDPAGPYAAVVPRWFAALLRGDEIAIHGDGETSRDFCYVANVVQANVLAATTTNPAAPGQVFNVAFGARTTLNELFELIRREVARLRPEAVHARAAYRDFRPGDVRHSLADVSRARTVLGYAPTHSVEEGLREAARWYATSHAPLASTSRSVAP
ncbi:SDR family oxidoreductase [Anaeromyxobacter oryzae]|uniref:NAD-dependent epimerase n=1 Tax=Anaeromyxobacter oryzae TaxID=2918170 RepID=A0ABN6MMW6_9BACT|nr:SDR family oxidoreductase [Anaeromyxobacter oryzae]BDG02306.1 NAD-dependent epimerase [Anaeromyxobacter oryzae]